MIDAIDGTAPVGARHGITIDAPLDVIRSLHVDVNAWPTWNPDITEARLDRPLAPGASFGWTTAGLAVQTTVYQVTEWVRTLWGGPDMGIVVIHEWTFAGTADGVLVRTKESWSGDPVEADLATAQTGLDRSLVSWLDHLKTAAEARS